jgi:hypothetical protein
MEKIINLPLFDSAMYPKPEQPQKEFNCDYTLYNNFENIQHNFAKNYMKNHYEKMYLSE